MGGVFSNAHYDLGGRGRWAFFQTPLPFGRTWEVCILTNAPTIWVDVGGRRFFKRPYGLGGWTCGRFFKRLIRFGRIWEVGVRKNAHTISGAGFTLGNSEQLRA